MPATICALWARIVSAAAMISQRITLAEKLIFRVEFGVESSRDWQTIKSDWGCARDRNVFQSTRWLSNWYEAFSVRADFEPVLLTVRNSQTGLVALRLPLVKYTVNGVCIVEFADLGVNAYNQPILGPAAPLEPEDVATMWRDLRSALRKDGVDLVRLGKMLVDLGGKPNPLALIEPARSSSIDGNLVTTGDDLDAYRFSIKKMQLARSWRVFTRHPDAAFRIITDAEEALRLLATMDDQQTKQYRRLGKSFLMDKPRATFYRNLVARGIDEGYAVMSALTCGKEVVAAALGIRQGSYYVVLRISNAAEQWSNCSPGRLILDRTIAALHKEGVRQFDLGPGNDELKRRFGAVSVTVADVTEALSLRGLLMFRASKWVRDHPRLKSFMQRVLRQVGVQSFLPSSH
jgi:CelD/BcsL family acetyltransferase involved in cellulose biosynthesis